MKTGLLILIFLSITACAIGNKYDYRQRGYELPVPASNEKVVVSVVELRPYVLTGQKKPDFVGVMRSDMYIPYSVTTSSGRPLVEDMSFVLSNALRRSGLHVTDALGLPIGSSLIEFSQTSGATRIIVLEVHEWKSDLMGYAKLSSSLRLLVLDVEGGELAQSDVKFEDTTLANYFDAEEVLVDEFVRQLLQLFSEPTVQKVLQMD